MQLTATQIAQLDATECPEALAGDWVPLEELTTEQGALRTWCDCRFQADKIHNIDNMRYAYLLTGLFFGGWAFVSLWVLVKNVKERGQLHAESEEKKKAASKSDASGNEGPEIHSLKRPSPFVPGILGTMQNKLFTLLLPTWVYDSLASAIIGSLLVFFIRYVVKPEYSNTEPPPVGYSCAPVGATDWKCSSNKVMGASVIALLLGAFAFTPLWLWAAKRCGKRNIWMLWSLLNGRVLVVP